MKTENHPIVTLNMFVNGAVVQSFFFADKSRREYRSVEDANFSIPEEEVDGTIEDVVKHFSVTVH